jgi:hypothetical protein
LIVVAVPPHRLGEPALGANQRLQLEAISGRRIGALYTVRRWLKEPAQSVL